MPAPGAAGNVMTSDGTLWQSSGLPANVAKTDAANTFTASQKIQNSAPLIMFSETDQPAGAKNWHLVANGQLFQLFTNDDSWGSPFAALSVDRAGVLTAQYPTGLWLPGFQTDAGPVTGQTYGVREGFWQRQGALVYFSGRINLTAAGAPMYGSSTYIIGLPFMSNPNFSVAGHVQISFFGGLGSPVSHIAAYIGANQNAAALVGTSGAAVGIGNLSGAYFPAGADIIFNGQYIV